MFWDPEIYMDSFQPIAENVLYQKTTCLAQQNVSANGIVQFIVNPGTYNVDQCEIQFPYNYIAQTGGITGAVGVLIGEQRFFLNCDQLIVYWDGKLVYNCQKPFITQKKFYDLFCSQKQNSTIFTTNQVTTIEQQKDVVTRAVADTAPVSQIGDAPQYISYPIRQFLPFLFRKDQQTFNVQNTMNIQVRINYLNIETRGLTGGIAALAIQAALMTTTQPKIQLMKLQNISIQDNVRSAYFQNIYNQNQINSAINIDAGSKSDYQLIGKMMLPGVAGYDLVDYSDVRCSARQPDGIWTFDQQNYSMINQIDGVQIVQGQNIFDASQQYKYLQKDQILPYLTSCVLYNNILGGGIHNFNIQQNNPMNGARECLVIGYQMYVGA